MVDTKSMADLLAEHPMFRGFDRETFEFLGGCATNHYFPVDACLFRADEPAQRFYLMRSGDVSLELNMPGSRRVVIQSIHAGQIVGASWLLPPYRWRFDARAATEVRAIGIDAECLRGKCDDNPTFGYAIYKRFLPVVAERLLATRLQLADFYSSHGEMV